MRFFVRRAALAAVAMPFLTVAAAADWEYTRWGQPLADVMAAPGKGVTKTSQEETRKKSIVHLGEAMARVEHHYEGRPVTAYFLFRNDRLTAVVTYFAAAADAEAVWTDRIARFGRPPKAEETVSYGCRKANSAWRDEAAGDAVDIRLFNCPNAQPISYMTFSSLSHPVNIGLR